MEDQEKLELNKKNIEAFKKLLDNGMLVEGIKELIQVCSETDNATLSIGRTRNNQQYVIKFNDRITITNEVFTECMIDAYRYLISERKVLKIPKRYTL